MTKHILALLCSWGAWLGRVEGVWAQQQFDSAHGNYAGLGGVSWNPATVAGNCYALQIRLVGLDGHFTNSGYRYTGTWAVGQPLADLNLSLASVQALQTGQPLLLSAGVEVRGPGVLVRLGPRSGLALGTRVRSLLQGNALSPSLVQNAVDGFHTPGAWRGSAFNFQFNTVAEWSATYGRVLLDRGRHLWKLGLTGKRLVGLGAAYAQGRDISYQVVPDPYNTKGPGLVLLDQLQGAYGYAHYASQPRLNLQTAQRYLLGQEAPGTGWGADLGFVYEYRRAKAPAAPARPRRGKARRERIRPDYLFRLGVAVTDIGSVAYTTNTVAYSGLLVRDNLLQKSDYNGINVSSYEGRLPGIYQTAGPAATDRYEAGMPTALHVDLDYQLSRSLYLNASVSQGLRGAMAVGMRSFSYACLAPRLETSRFGLAVPLALGNEYQQLAVGCQLRLGFLTVGSNNLAVFFSGAQPYGANAYAEVSLLNLAARHRPAAPPTSPQ